MNPTAIVLSYFLREPTMKATAKTWLEKEPDPVRRACEFASALSGDFEEQFLGWAGDEAKLMDAICQLFIERVNWRRVATEILARFGRKLPASYLAATPSVN